MIFEQAPGFEPAKKQVEPQQKGRRQYAGLPWQILQGGAAILQGAPKILPPGNGGLIFEQAPGFEPAKKQFEPPQKGGRQYAGLRLANFARWRSNPNGRARIKISPNG